MQQVPVPLRVLLVRPPGRFTSLEFPDGPMVGIPRALLYLEAAVRGDPRVHVELLDALAHPDPARLASPERPVLFGLTADEIADHAVRSRVDVVAISTMANYYRRETLEIAAAVRARLPDAFLLLGGPDPTVDADRYLADGPFDAICIGEGEATFADLLGRLADHQSWSDVPGLAFRDPTARDRVVRTPPRPLLDDLDAVRVDYDRVDLPRYFDLAARGFRSRPTRPRPGVERSVDVVTSRGCPYTCAFCVIHTTMGRRYRARSVASVVDELRELARRGVSHVHLEDDLLNLDRKRLKDLLGAIIDAKLPLTFDTPNGLRADLLDRELVDRFVAAGFSYLILGVESGRQQVLDDIATKDLDLAAVVTAARLCAEARLDVLAFYIVGMPGETVSDAEATLDFALKLFEEHGVTPLLQVWRPYVGTALYDTALASDAIRPAVPAELSAATGIPYTQFRDRIGAALTPADLASLFTRYTARLAQGQLSRWRKAGQRVPFAADPATARADVARFLLRDAPYLHAATRST